MLPWYHNDCGLDEDVDGEDVLMNHKGLNREEVRVRP